MLKSMTAYGRASLDTKVGHFIIEIQSVNRKFLDINVALPRELNQFDIELKKWLTVHLARGQVSVKVNVSFEGAVPFIIRPNLPLARQIKAAWDKIRVDLDISEAFSLSLLKHTEDLLSYEENREEEEEYRYFLKQCFDEAFQGFLNMKIQEGSVLKADIMQRLEKISQEMKGIDQKAPFATKKYREKLVNRLNEIMPGHLENEERILREIAIFAEKIDITEEMVRFSCHLNHLHEILDSSSLSVGKTLEFVLQELNREINTIGNKSSDLEIARAVIEIKSELERIREQIQNIE